MKNTSLHMNSIGSKLAHSLVFILFFALAVVELFPFLWMFMSGFKSSQEMFMQPYALPSVWIFQNYATAWRSGIAKYLINSTLVTALSTTLSLFIGALAAYPLARFRFRGNRAVLMLILSGLMLSPVVSLIPLYKVLSAIKLYNTYFAMIIPYIAFRIPFTVFLLWSNFITIPREIEEAAVVDGCSTFRIFYRIIVPLSKPMLATAALLSVQFAWNEMMFALCFVESGALKTIPVGLLSLRSQTETNWAILVAGLALSTLPIVILYIIFQKQLVRGMTAGSVKG